MYNTWLPSPSSHTQRESELQEDLTGMSQILQNPLSIIKQAILVYFCSSCVVLTQSVLDGK